MLSLELNRPQQQPGCVDFPDDEHYEFRAPFFSAAAKTVIQEFKDCLLLQPVEISRLIKKWRIPFEALLGDGGYNGFVVKTDQVTFLKDERFEFERYRHSESPADKAVIIVARGETSEPVDLVAWCPANGHFAPWLGRVAILGAHVISEPRLNAPLMVFPSPIEWLRAGRRGVVILNLVLARSLLCAEQPLGVNNLDFGFALRKQLIPPSPRIMMARSLICGGVA
jgi:hypothetical protein